MTIHMTSLYRDQLAKDQWAVILVEAEWLLAPERNLSDCAHSNIPMSFVSLLKSLLSAPTMPMDGSHGGENHGQILV